MILKHKAFIKSLALLKFAAFASTAGGLRTCAGAAFGSFEKQASHFSNHACGVTEPKEAPYTGTGENPKYRPFNFTTVLMAQPVKI